MCTYSMVIDSRYDDWFQRQLLPQPPVPLVPPHEIDEFKRLLERAREYDRQHNQPDCELEEKKATLRKLAEQLGIQVEIP